MAVAVAVFRYDVVSIIHSDADSDLGWKLDKKYSAELTIMANTTTMDEASDPIYRTTNLRIYSGSTEGNAMPSYLSEIFANKLLFESSDKGLIGDFIGAARKEEAPGNFNVVLGGCSRLYFVMLNNNERIAGYFLFYKCDSSYGTIGVIRPYQYGDSSSIYYNSSLLQIIKKTVLVQ